MKQVSMQMIADALDISKNSVSQALRNENGVSEETKIIVRAKAEELGYKYAKQNRKEKGCFLIVATDFAFSQLSFFDKIIRSIEYTASHEKYKTERAVITEEMVNNKILPKNLSKYDGLFVISHITDDYISLLTQQAIPCVVVDHHSQKFLADCILTNNRDGAYEAVKYLISHDNKNIGFIGDINFSPSYFERYRGYVHTLEDFNIPVIEEYQITEIEENQAVLFSKLKQIKTMPDAWFCVNSGLAYILNYYLQSEGYKVPEDIGIICFDNTEFTQMSNPKITNISTNLEFMGKQAVSSMLERLSHPAMPIVYKQIMPSLIILGTV